MDCTKVPKEDATLFVIFMYGRFVVGKVESEQHTTCSYKANIARTTDVTSGVGESRDIYTISNIGRTKIKQTWHVHEKHVTDASRSALP